MALTNKLSAIGDAIRAKTGKTELLTLDEMPTEIGAIETGGGGGGVELPEEAYVITGNCSYKFAYGGWNWFIDMFGDKITTKDIINCQYMFFSNKTLNSFPCEINIVSGSSQSFSQMFASSYLRQLPLIKGVLTTPTGNYYNNPSFMYFIYDCSYLREIPYDYFDNFGGNEFWAAAQQYTGSRSNFISNCTSLRQLPDLSKVITMATGSSNFYYNFGSSCYALDEAIDIPVSAATFTSNCFSNFMARTSRAKNICFKTNADGSAKTADWKSQTIDLSFEVGYNESYSNYFYGFNSGITKDKLVSDEITYQALKNDPDWCAVKITYSRYNHDSAVATINSLPDTSAYLATAGGTNTIKFKGLSGRDTDGGAINTLTEEEIAVATAKGWTVTLV